MISQKTFAKYAADPAAFRADLIVDVDGLPPLRRRDGPVAAEDFAALDPALTALRRPQDAEPRDRCGPTLNAAEGHSKTTDLAVTGGLGFGLRYPADQGLLLRRRQGSSPAAPRRDADDNPAEPVARRDPDGRGPPGRESRLPGIPAKAAR